MFKILMTEPRRGYEVLLRIFELGERYPRLGNFYPIGADIFVFVYPVFLTVLYLYGLRKKEIEAKKEALFIFFACFFSVLMNILSQQFFDKQRPIYEFGIQNLDQETLLHQFLPSTSFPSDHAVVTFSIAMATWLIAHKHHNKKLKIWSAFLFLFAIITGICRIGTTVHWTTDILAGTIMGILVPIVLMLPLVFKAIEKWLLLPIIRVEEWLIQKVFQCKKILRGVLIFMLVGGGLTAYLYTQKAENHEENPLEKGLLTFNQERPLQSGYSEYGLLERPNGKITLDDFKNCASFKAFPDHEAMHSYFESFAFSDTPDEVPIGLSLLSDATLITPHEYNKRSAENTEWEGLGLYAVSLKDFREVTGLEEATSDYMVFFDGYWIFDYETKFYTNRKAMNDAVIRRLKLLTPEQKEQAKRGEYSKLPPLPEQE